MRGFAGFEGGVALVDLVPVDDVPPGGEIFRTTVVVFQVVGVLPDVVAEDGIQSLRNGIVLIWRRHDLHFAVRLARKPYPSRAELLRASIVEFGFEIVEVAKGFLNRLSDGSVRIASALRLHDLP